VRQRRHERGRGVHRQFALQGEAGEIPRPAGDAHDRPRRDPQRLHPPRDAGEDPPGVEVAHRMAAEDVAPAAPAAFGRGQDPAGDVTDVDEVVGPRRGEEPLPGADLEEHASARGLPVPGTEHVDGIHDHAVEAGDDLLLDHAFGVTLGDHVGAFRHPPRRGLLVGRETVAAQADRVDARHLDEPGAGAPGRDGDDPRPVDVGRGHLRAVPPAAVDHRRGVDDDPGPVDRAFDGRRVAEVADDRLHR